LVGVAPVGTVVVPATFGWVALVLMAWTMVFALTECPGVGAVAVGVVGVGTGCSGGPVGTMVIVTATVANTG
jgi:hypothetical protein